MVYVCASRSVSFLYIVYSGDSKVLSRLTNCLKHTAGSVDRSVVWAAAPAGCWCLSAIRHDAGNTPESTPSPVDRYEEKECAGDKLLMNVTHDALLAVSQHTSREQTTCYT